MAHRVLVPDAATATVQQDHIETRQVRPGVIRPAETLRHGNVEDTKDSEAIEIEGVEGRDEEPQPVESWEEASQVFENPVRTKGRGSNWKENPGSRYIRPALPTETIPFCSGYDFENDEQYRVLTRNMRPREIEFAKALVLSGGNRKHAFKMTVPTCTDATANKEGSKLSARVDVSRLFNYLRTLPDTDTPPLSRDEIEQILTNDFRKVRDPKLRLEIARWLTAFKGWDRNVSPPNAGEEQLTALLDGFTKKS